MCFPWAYEFTELGEKLIIHGPFPTRRIASEHRTSLFIVKKNICSPVRATPVSGEELKKLKEIYSKKKKRALGRNGRKPPIIAKNYFSPTSIKKAMSQKRSPGR